jgi:uncharacterized protein
VNSVMLYLEHRPRAPLRSVAVLAASAVAGAPLGIVLLTRSDEAMLHLLVGGGVLASATVNLVQRGTRPAVRPDRVALQAAAGFTSGIMRGALSMPGPPVILYQHWVGGGSGTIRSRMFAFFLWMSLPTVVIAAIGGVVTWNIVFHTTAAAPAILAGVWAGRPLRSRLSEGWFSRLTMLLLALTSALAVGGAIAAFSR